MKNTNITLHTTQKKEYVLTGILSLPLHLGERAWIYSYNQTLPFHTKNVWSLPVSLLYQPMILNV